MIKRIWIVSTFITGIVLCVFGNAAFAVVGVVFGLATGVAGIFFVSGISKSGVFGGFLTAKGRNGGGILYHLATFGASRMGGAIIGSVLVAIGLLIIVLCLFVESVAFFLGGIITLAAGIIILPICTRHHRYVFPFCLCCIAVGAFMLFAPAFIWWICVAMGIGLIIFSGVLLITAD